MIIFIFSKSYSRVTSPFWKKSILSAIPSRRGGSKSQHKKDQNENESCQKPNIPTRNPTRVVNKKRTKALRSKRNNSDSCVKKAKEASKAGKNELREKSNFQLYQGNNEEELLNQFHRFSIISVQYFSFSKITFFQFLC